MIGIFVVCFAGGCFDYWPIMSPCTSLLLCFSCILAASVLAVYSQSQGELAKFL